MIVSKKLSWWVELKTIHCYHLKSHLISTHSMAVKDSNFLIFFSCHVIQTLICFHVSYLGVRKSTSQKADIFKKELGLYQTTLTPVLSAIYLQVIYKNCKVYEWYYSERMLTMTQTPRQMIKLLCYRVTLLSLLLGSSHLETPFSQRLSYNAMDSIPPPAQSYQKFQSTLLGTVSLISFEVTGDVVQFLQFLRYRINTMNSSLLIAA